MKTLLNLSLLLLPILLIAEPYKVDPGAPDLPQKIDLSTALAYALEHNFSILQAKERIRQEYGLSMEVRAAGLPHLALNGNYIEEDKSMAAPFANENNWSATIGITQAIYSGGNLDAAVSAQKHHKQMARHEMQATVEEAILQVTTRFYDVLLARDTITVEEENINLLKEQLANIKNRFETGAVSNFDVLQAEVSLANARPALIRSRNNFRIAGEELRNAVGYMNVRKHNIDRVPEFIGKLDIEPVNFDLNNALHAAIDNRSELKLLEKQVRADKEKIKMARSGYRPKLSAVGRYDIRRSYNQVDRFDSPDKGWYLGLSSSWDIFDGRATKGKVIQARSALRQAQLQLKEKHLDIEVEVRRAISALQEATELAEAAQQVSKQAGEALRMANERYNVGSSTYLDTLQARVSLTEARNNELLANYSYLVAVASFKRSIGCVGTE